GQSLRCVVFELSEGPVAARRDTAETMPEDPYEEIAVGYLRPTVILRRLISGAEVFHLDALVPIEVLDGGVRLLPIPDQVVAGRAEEHFHSRNIGKINWQCQTAGNDIKRCGTN